MKKLLVLLGCSILVASMVGPAGAATLVNDDFENGIGSEWTIVNDVQLATAGLSLNLLGMTDKFALLGFDQSADLSELSQTVFAPATTARLTVSFDWAFDFIDLSTGNDAFVSVLTSDGGITKSMVDINTGSGSASAFGSFDQTFNLPELEASGGFVEIAFSLLENPDSLTNSFAGIDDVSVVAEAAVTPVPIPATLLLFGSGLIGMIGLKRRKKA